MGNSTKMYYLLYTITKNSSNTPTLVVAYMTQVQTSRLAKEILNFGNGPIGLYQAPLVNTNKELNFAESSVDSVLLLTKCKIKGTKIVQTSRYET